MAFKSVAEIQASIDTLTERLAKQHLLLKQAGFVEKLVKGVRVDGKVGDEEFTNAKILAVTEADGTSGAWFRVRLHEDTDQETVRSIRLSAITGISGDEAAPADAGLDEAGTDTPSDLDI